MKLKPFIKSIFNISLLFFVSVAYSQAPEVPSRMKFADVELIISEGARKIIQTDADNLVRYPKYFETKLERVRLYMPIIERILKEEGLPEDFKYLTIQESALIADAVSSSNAVGFWQFKKESGVEVGLRIDDHVDERMNIVSSTRGAARYLKRNNFYFDNWVFALLSYYLGRGGASNIVDKSLYGAKRLKIDESTNWYILRNLAHKLVFEEAMSRGNTSEYQLAEYQDGARKNLKQIAQELNLEEDLIKDYNKWLKRGNIPEDRLYTVIAPVFSEEYKKLQAKNVLVVNEVPGTSSKKPNPQEVKFLRDEAHLIEVNNIKAFVAREGDDIVLLTVKAGITKKNFFKYNELAPGAKLETGQIYYLKNKKNKAKLYFHTVKEGEGLWSISQKYGIKTKAILRKNRMRNEKELQVGRILWLHKTRPLKQEPEYLNEGVKLKQIQEEITEDQVKPVKPQQTEETSGDVVIIEKEEEKIESKEIEVIAVNNVDETKGLYHENVTSEQEEIEEGVDNEDDGEEVVVIEDDLEEVNEEAEVSMQVQESNEVEIEVTEERLPSFDEGPVGVRFVEVSKIESEKKGVHTVQKGETLYSISRKYGLTVPQILAFNNLEIEEGIKIGQELKLANAAKSEVAVIEVDRPYKKEEELKKSDEYIYHTVVAGETLYKIAREYQVTIKDVMDWNDKDDFNVGAGEVLKIKK